MKKKPRYMLIDIPGTELSNELRRAAMLAFDAIDWQLNCWDVDENGAPPDDLLGALTALSTALGEQPTPAARAWLGVQ